MKQPTIATEDAGSYTTYVRGTMSVQRTVDCSRDSQIRLSAGVLGSRVRLTRKTILMASSHRSREVMLLPFPNCHLLYGARCNDYFWRSGRRDLVAVLRPRFRMALLHARH